MDNHAVLTDSLLNYETVKYFDAESAISLRYDDALCQTESLWRRFYVTRVGNGLLTALIFAASLATSLLYAGYEVAHGTMTVGDFVLVNSYVLRLVQPLEMVGNAVRDVRLLAGEALFNVARDPARPFRVHSGRAVIQAVGTQFNVYRRSQDATVSVIEGSVKISREDAPMEDASPPPLDAGSRPEAAVGSKASVPGPGVHEQHNGLPIALAAGEQAHIALNGQVTEVTAANPVAAAAWRQRRLIFRGERLADIAAEFNRYNRQPHFRVDGDAIGDQRLTGVFDADAPQSFIRFLTQAGDVTIKQNAGEAVIQSR